MQIVKPQKTGSMKTFFQVISVLFAAIMVVGLVFRARSAVRKVRAKKTPQLTGFWFIRKFRSRRILAGVNALNSEIGSSKRSTKNTNKCIVSGA